MTTPQKLNPLQARLAVVRQQWTLSDLFRFLLPVLGHLVFSAFLLTRNWLTALLVFFTPYYAAYVVFEWWYSSQERRKWRILPVMSWTFNLTLFVLLLAIAIWLRQQFRS
ncbi:hypothetical protein L6R29_05980 [Myxococcota bacterium]|nr:hypothetical protein [Myxococcota bacterium]